MVYVFFVIIEQQELIWLKLSTNPAYIPIRSNIGMRTFRLFSPFQDGDRFYV